MDISATQLASLSGDTLVTHSGKACSMNAHTAANSGSSSAGRFLLLLSDGIVDVQVDGSQEVEVCGVKCVLALFANTASYGRKKRERTRQ